MYIIIIGCGRMGSTLAKELSIEGHDIVIIDRDREKLDILGSGFNGHRIKGIEFDNDILLDAGINKADLFLAMTQDDNINITGAQFAKNVYKVPRVIARLCDPNREYIYNKLSIETICPTRLGAHMLKARIISMDLEVVASLSDDIDIIRIPISKEQHKSVIEIESKYSCSVVGIIRNGKTSLPRKDDSLYVGDSIICSINKKHRQKLISALTKEMTI